MTQSNADQQTAPADGADNGQLAPAALAARAVALADHGSAPGTPAAVLAGAASAGTLPVWVRPGEPRRRTWLSRLTHFAAWCVTLGLLVVAALRIGYHDATVLLIWLNSFTLYIYLPAYVILAVAVWRQHWLLAAATAAVVLCHLIWIARDFRPATPYQPPSVASASSRPIRIFYANVRASNRDFDGILGEISQADPDVVVLVEVDRGWFDVLKPSPVMKPFVHGTALAEPFMGEVMVCSKLPVSGHQRIWIVGRVCNLVDISLDGRTLRLFCLHSPRPNVTSPDAYRVYWEKITPLLAEQPRPLVVIGDFNATQYSLAFQRLASLGLRSAHVDRGRGYATTWPNGQHLVPPIRIDHALVSSDVECLGIAAGVGLGSDHKPLVLVVRVHSSGTPTLGAAPGD